MDHSKENSSDLVNLNWVVYIDSENATDSFNDLEKLINKYLNNIEAGYNINIKPYISESFKKLDENQRDTYVFDPDITAEIRQDETVTAVKAQYPEADLISFNNGLLLEGYYKGLSYYEDACSKDMLLDLEPFLASEQGENIKELLDENELNLARVDHKLYGLRDYKHGIQSYIYNLEVVNKYDIEKETLNGNILDQINNFPQMLEDNITSVYTLADDVLIYAAPINYTSIDRCSNVIIEPNGKVSSYFDLPEAEEYLTTLADLKEQDMLRFLQLTDSIDRESFYMMRDMTDFLTVNDLEIELKTSNGLKNFEVLSVPDTSNYRLSDNADNYVNSIFKDSKNPDQAFDFLARLLCDQKLISLITDNLKYEEYTSILASVNIFNQLEQEDRAIYQTMLEPFKDICGFRFDTTPVLKEVEQVNSVIGSYVRVDDTLSEAAMAIYDLEQPMEKHISDIKKQLDEAGIKTVIAEVEHQYQEWLELKDD